MKQMNGSNFFGKKTICSIKDTFMTIVVCLLFGMQGNNPKLFWI